LVEVNNYRVKNNLSLLVIDKRLKPLVTQHLNYMVESHTLPLDHSQKLNTKYPKKFNDFTERCDYILKEDYTYVGEVCVVAIEESDLNILAKKIVTLWINSPSHNEALLKSYIKGAYVKTSKSNMYVTNNGDVFKDKYIYCTLNTILE
jgi:uncharacterized protein YkwD